MAITFKVAALRTAASLAVTKHDQAAEVYDRSLAEYRTNYRHEWTANNLEGVKNLRDYLTKCLSKAIAPEQREAKRLFGNRDGYGDITFYSEPSAPNGLIKPIMRRYDTYVALVSFLEAFEPDTISDSQLKACGFDDLAQLFRDATVSGGKV
jgi:hypothetical protein